MPSLKLFFRVLGVVALPAFCPAQVPESAAQAIPVQPSAAGSTFETPKVWPATTFLPNAHIPANGWRIDPVVSNDGIYNTWGVSSAVGPFQVTGNERLIELLREIEATIRLQEISKGKEFAMGLADAGKEKWDSVVHVARDPVGTVTKLPQGASRFLGRVGNTVKHTVQGKLDIDTKAKPEDTARNLLGIEKAKRLIAAELGVNPFSHNAALQRALNDVATVRAFGKLTVNVGSMVVVPVTAGWVMTGTNVATSLTTEQVAADPKELAAANRKHAMAMGIPAASFEALNSNAHYDPWTLTAIWNSLAALGPVNPTSFVDIAASATSDLDAFFFLRVSQTMANLQMRGANIVELLPLPYTVACVQKNGALLLPLWLDYAIWTPEAEAAALEFQALQQSRKAPQAIVVTSGDFSPEASAQIQHLGIQILPHAQVAGAK